MREEKESITPNEASSSKIAAACKVLVSIALLVSSVHTYQSHNATSVQNADHRRRLSFVTESPSYMEDLMEDLRERKKLFDETPPEEVKYWFEYTGPLQKYFYRYSKSRGKADYFEGRDDSGVVSARFVSPGGGDEFSHFFNTADRSIPKDEQAMHYRLLDNCFAMGSSKRPNLSDWKSWFAGGSDGKVTDRCRVLVTMNTAGAGKGSTMLWETKPPTKHAAGPQPWTSEQATAATHLERNLKEMDEMCATGLIAIRLQLLVCEPIPGVWTDWMDSMLPNCGGSKAPLADLPSNIKNAYEDGVEVEDRASPVQVVVVASASTADTCHNLKSGFMEKRVQDLILSPPYLTSENVPKNFDPAQKTTHPDLVSSDDHDMYIGLKWSSLITTRSVFSFLQASADLAAAAASPNNKENEGDESNIVLDSSPSSPFLIPSFTRVSYLSEENNKVAKWRLHGDFFHPSAWEICRDSFDMTWIPDSLSGNGGVSGICYDKSTSGFSNTSRRLNGEECGQWWIYMTEEQMALSPEVYANEVSAPLFQGGSNNIWMLTERQRKELVSLKVCQQHAGKDEAKLKKCGENPQAVIPLGDMESFEINFMANNALGKKHNIGRRPGYSKEQEYIKDRELVRERKQLKGQEDIEKALFDYTVYPSALFRKDATIKAARIRDRIMTKDTPKDSYPPYTVKSEYYDVTIKKPRMPVPGWCQVIARKGLCTLYAEYFRESSDNRCSEACGLKKNFSPMQ